MRRITVALTTAAIAAGALGMAAPAQGALSATASGAGLSITGDSSRNQVGLHLQLGSAGLEWRVHQTCILFCAEGVQPGPGCRAGADSSEVLCERVGKGKGVTVALGSGDDHFAVGDATPVTDPIVVNGQTGDDNISGGAGPDSIQGGSGDDKLRAGLGADTVAGSIGQDLLTGDGGDDALDGGDGNDVLDPGTGADTAEGQAGDDTIHLGTAVKDEKDTVNGGIGNDSVTYAAAVLYPGFPNIPAIPGRATAVRIVEANLETLAGAKDFSEGDVLHSIERYRGGLDEDIITGVLSSNISDYFGDNDDDTIFGTSAANTIVGGAGDDELSGKAGDDIIDAKTGEVSTGPHTDFVIDCGDGTGDTALLDLKDDLTPTGCEFKERSPLGEGPHVRLNVTKRTAVAGGQATFRLSCPRALKRACAGTLRLQLGRASSPRTSYSIAPGRSKRVAVRLGGLAPRIRARTKAALVSVERGIKGAKTTERPAVLSAP
jgi:Ca2+-binding RTX toxin-like protein